MTTPPGPESARAILLFEPRVEGHHLSWMHHITEDVLSGGYKITLACDFRAKARERIEADFGDLATALDIVSIYRDDGSVAGGSMIGAIREFAAPLGSARIFLCNFDEIASDLFRRAGFGFMPPPDLRGRLGGVYHRPTFLLKRGFSLNRWIKKAGFRRMIRGRWFSTLMFLDEFLAEQLKQDHPEAPFWRLATPGPGDFDIPQDEARRALEIPADKKVFLFYGGPYRRKGLHLTVSAFENMAADRSAFLLCAGEQGKDPAVLARLKQLEAQGRARILSRYVSSQEESLCFCASDVVLLPYIGHLISSGVMAQACVAGKPVIVSDEGLLARRVRQHDLGQVFPSGSVPGLEAAIESMEKRIETESSRWRTNALQHAAEHSRAVFRRQLLEALDAEAKNQAA